MARQKASKPAGSDGANRETGMTTRRITIHATIALIFLSVGGYGFYRLKQHVERDLSYPATAPQIMLKDRPLWMSDALAEQIASSAQPKIISSALDQSVLQGVYRKLEANPWVKQIRQVRRAFGKEAGDTIEIDCEYRAPIALVATRNEYILIDGEGVRLPGKFPIAQSEPRIMFAEDGQVNIRIIEGVAAPAPRLDGQKWPGDDLKAGLDLVRLLYGRPATEEIYRVNVANFKRRQRPYDAQIVLVTRYRSEVRWGEPVMAAFYAELTPAEKLERLALLKERYHRVDMGHSWVDIRLDKVSFPEEEQPIVQAGN